MATDLSDEITSSNSFFSQPFMVEIIKLLAGVIFWEIQFVLSKFFLNVLPDNSEKEKLFKRTAPSYCVSTVHATFLTWGGVKIICALYNAPQNEQVILYESTDGSFVAFCEFISGVFVVHDPGFLSRGAPLSRVGGHRYGRSPRVVFRGWIFGVYLRRISVDVGILDDL